MGSADRPKTRRRPGARRRAREVALAALYRADLLELNDSAALVSLPEVLSLNQETWPEADRREERLRAQALAYAHEAVTGVFLERESIDTAIDALATDWRLDRLSVTDRNILRIAMWELARGEEPAAVVINEAVEVAQEYGGPESSKFVNGILGAWAERLGDREGGVGDAAAPRDNGGS